MARLLFTKKLLRLQRGEYHMINYTIRALLLLMTLGCASPVNAGLILNGDFTTGDSSSWQTDTDGTPGSAPDFIFTTGFATLNIDYQDTQAWFANTLFQQVTLKEPSALGWFFQFTYAFDGEENGWPQSGRDGFSVYLGDGSGRAFDGQGKPGHLFSLMKYGQDTVSFLLSPEWWTSGGFSIEFQLFAGADINGLGSHLILSDIQLTPQVSSVPSSSSIGLFVSGLMLLWRRHIQ